MSADPNIGRKVSNRYELVEPLGKGSMGNVYGAKDLLLGGVSVAVKFLVKTLLNQKMRERFEREATTCAMLGQKSINIIRVTDYGVDEHGVPYYIMEYLKGDSLHELVRANPIPLPRFLGLVRQICLGLQCAHNGINLHGETYPIIHRDIKPSNIFITRDDSLGELVKILDFGIAKTLQEDTDQTRCFMGTLAYASPEQMEGRELDGRSDIYSLGILMFQMLTGKMPLNADTHTFGSWYKTHQEQVPRSFRSVRPDLEIPKALEQLIMSCLAKDPGDRPQTATDIVSALTPLDERYKPGREIGYGIGRVLSRVPVNPKRKPVKAVSPDDICRLQSWPQDKPLAGIVFPHILRTSNELLATLWVMLPRADISELALCIAYNKFMFMANPHPVMLWITVLYSKEHGPRWLPCYLDLKKREGYQMVRLLSEAKHYRVLFFAQEEPQTCARVMTLTITEPSTLVSTDLINKQADYLRECAGLAQTAPKTKASLSKPYLKTELDTLKPTIVKKLESIR